MTGRSIRALALSAVIGLSLLAADGGARAQSSDVITGGGLSLTQLAHQAQALAAGDREVRKSAFTALSTLSLASLPAARDHFTSLLRSRPAPEEALRVLTAFRHAAGSKRADDEVDLAQGVLPVLATERSPAVLSMALPLLYLRSLEALDDPDAYLAIAGFVGLDSGAWENELRLVRKREGARLLPALIKLRSHESADVRRFAQAGVSALGMDDPQLALSTDDPYMLANLVRAYASPPDYAAMPLIVRMVNDPHIQVRQAARATLARYGKNAIWQVRELYEEVSGQPASRGWSFERSSSELYAVLDRPELEDAETLLARGMKSFVAGDLAAMRRDYDVLLAKYPDFEGKAKLADGYAAVGGERLAEDELSGALDGYRRALRLAPQAPDAKLWQAQVAYAGAELALSEGVVDLAAYDRALALDPNLKAAELARDRLSGAATQRIQTTKRYAAAAALALLLALAFMALRMRPPTRVEPASRDPEPAE